MRSIAEEFGINVKNARNILGITQEELAEKSDTDRKTINNIENGRGNPNLLTIQLLAKGLNMKIHELFYFDYEEMEENLND